MVMKMSPNVLRVLAGFPAEVFDTVLQQAVRAHIGYFQCAEVETDLAGHKCTVCFARYLLEEFGIPEEITKHYYDILRGKGQWDAELPKSLEVHEKKKVLAFDEGKIEGEKILAGEMPDSGILSYAGEYPEEFIRGVKTILEAAGSVVLTGHPDAPILH